MEEYRPLLIYGSAAFLMLCQIKAGIELIKWVLRRGNEDNTVR